MKRWKVETIATVRRTYIVEAEDETSAREASRGVPPDQEEDDDEITESLTQVAPRAHG